MAELNSEKAESSVGSCDINLNKKLESALHFSVNHTQNIDAATQYHVKDK